jgi:rhodanese-related sulfurtransferase
MRRLLLASCLALAGMAQALEVNIAADLPSVEVTHQGQPVKIMRAQDPAHSIDPEYAKTSRACPPFCIQPMTIAPGVETVGELELLKYLDRMSWGEPVVVIDSRTPNWMEQGTIPGAVNLSWTRLSLEAGANPLEIGEIMREEFGVAEQDGLWDFTSAKTLVLFCNGPWCGQSGAAIRTLLRYGYPVDKLKWYRGGMQAWKSFGLTTVGEK